MTEVSGATLGSLGGRGRVGKMSKIKKKLHRKYLRKIASNIDMNIVHAYPTK
jgi:hypothetical protein